MHVNIGFRDLVVASPIEDYFIYIDELADKEKVILQLNCLSLLKITLSSVLLLSIKLSCQFI